MTIQTKGNLLKELLEKQLGQESFSFIMLDLAIFSYMTIEQQEKFFEEITDRCLVNI